MLPLYHSLVQALPIFSNHYSFTTFPVSVIIAMLLQSAMLLLLLLFSVFGLGASHDSSPYLSSLPYLSSRASYPRDVEGNWTFIYSQNDDLCPRSIRHLGFYRREKEPIRIYHHRIVQDGVQCENDRLLEGRSFRFYESKIVRAAFRNRTTPYKVPKKLVRLLNASLPTKWAFRAGNRHKETYFIGYEASNRVCDDKKVFTQGSTAFLFRPTTTSLAIKGIDILFEPGKRYLVMIPLFKSTSCVYSSELEYVASAAEAVEAEATPSPEDLGEVDSGVELEGSGNGGSCFPATATVDLADGRKIMMKDLSITDSVRAGNDNYASVFMFTHRLRSFIGLFRRIELESGEILDVTPGHFVYADGNLKAASQARAGDMMPLANGTNSRVKSVNTVRGVGLYNPQTTHGDIVVNGVRVSTYTEALKPEVAHTILAPLRAAFRLLKLDLSFGVVNSGARAAN